MLTIDLKKNCVILTEPLAASWGVHPVRLSANALSS